MRSQWSCWRSVPTWTGLKGICDDACGELFVLSVVWSVRFLCTETTSTSTTTAAVTVGTGTVETTTASTSIFKLLTIIFSVLVGLGLLWILLLFCCLYVWYPPGWRRGGVIVRRRYVTADPYGTSDPYNRGYPPVRSQRPFPPYSNVIAPGTPAPMPNYYWDIGDETFRPILDGLLAMYAASRSRKLGWHCIFAIAVSNVRRFSLFFRSCDQKWLPQRPIEARHATLQLCCHFTLLS